MASDLGKRLIYALMKAEGVPEGEIAMHRFCDALADQQAPFEKDLQFFCIAFSKIIKGENPKKALQIERTRGRKATMADWSRELSITRELIGQVAQGKRIPGELKRRIAKKHRISIPTINRYILEHQKLAYWFNDFVEDIPRRKKQHEELKNLFGEGVGKWSRSGADKVAAALDSASPSEYNEIRSTIKSFLEQKAK